MTARQRHILKKNKEEKGPEHFVVKIDCGL